MKNTNPTDLTKQSKIISFKKYGKQRPYSIANNVHYNVDTTHTQLNMRIGKIKLHIFLSEKTKQQKKIEQQISFESQPIQV